MNILSEAFVLAQMMGAAGLAAGLGGFVIIVIFAGVVLLLVGFLKVLVNLFRYRFARLAPPILAFARGALDFGLGVLRHLVGIVGSFAPGKLRFLGRHFTAWFVLALAVWMSDLAIERVPVLSLASLILSLPTCFVVWLGYIAWKKRSLRFADLRLAIYLAFFYLTPIIALVPTVGGIIMKYGLD